MDLTLVEAKSALAKAKDDVAQYYNWCQIPAPEYQVRDKVYLDASDIHTTHPSQKLAHHYLGPFMIVQKIGWNTYWLCLLASMSHLHHVFNVIKLLSTPSDPIPGRKASLPPPPEIVDGEEHYVVEQILDIWFMRGTSSSLWNGKDMDMRKIHGFQSKMLLPQTNSVSSIRHSLVLHVGFVWWPSNPSCPVLQGHSTLEGGWCQGTPHLTFLPLSWNSTPLHFPSQTLLCI